jgi:cAMP phosphodiesterase
LRLRVLGCYGGSAPGLHPSSLLLDEHLALDAGALTVALPLEAQAAVDRVVVTHAHLDHVANLPFLIDNVFPLRETPVVVMGSAETVTTLREHLFNDRLWPDFTRLSNGRTHLLEFEEVEPGRSVTCGDLELTPFSMDHTVPCQGYLVQGAGASVAVCGDTCSTDGVAQALAGARDLAAILLEISFPERAADVAAASRHLTPRGFAEEAARLPAGVPVYVWHLKPDMRAELEVEIAALGLPHVQLLEQGAEYTF